MPAIKIPKRTVTFQTVDTILGPREIAVYEVEEPPQPSPQTDSYPDGHYEANSLPRVRGTLQGISEEV